MVPFGSAMPPILANTLLDFAVSGIIKVESTLRVFAKKSERKRKTKARTENYKG